MDINLANGIGVRTHKLVWLARLYDKHIPSPGFAPLTIHGPLWATGNDLEDFVVLMPVQPRTTTWFRDHQEERNIGVMLDPYELMRHSHKRQQCLMRKIHSGLIPNPYP